MENLVNAANHYAVNRGWAVLPIYGVTDEGECQCGKPDCSSPGKHPMTRNGLKDATKDKAEIETWPAGCNVGVVTGEISGIFVLDIDGQAGEDSLHELQLRNGDLPATLIHYTGNGRHLVFNHPGSRIKNSVKKLGAGLDIRGDGGYIVAAPSLHISGATYRFANKTAAIADAPQWLIDLIKADQPIVETHYQGAHEHHDTELQEADVQDMLSYIDPDLAYDDWVSIGMGLHAGGYPLQMWDTWSRNGAKYVHGDCAKRWKGFKPNGQTTMGSVWHFAQAGGWHPSMLYEGKPLDELGLQMAQAILAQKEPELTHKSGNLGVEGRSEQKAIALESMIDSNNRTSKAEWTKPVDIFGEFKVPDLPRNALPDVIDAFSSGEAELLGVDPGGLALSALVVCAGLIPDAFKVQVKVHDPDWKEAARLWGMLVGEPSTKKSPIISAAMKPVKTHQTKLFTHHKEQIAAYKKQLTIFEEKKAELKKNTKSTGEGQDKSFELEPPIPPSAPRRLYSNNTTIEALQEILVINRQGILIEHDELTGWIGSMDKYSGSRGANVDRAFWLTAFNGGPHLVDRIGRGNKEIPNLSVCVLGGIQPDVIASDISKMQHDGTLQRFLPVNLGPAQPSRDMPIDGPFRFDYEKVVGNLVDMILPEDPDRDYVVRFDDKAQKIRYKFVNYAFKLSTLDEIGKKFTAWAGKLEGMFARMCLVFHCIEEVSDHKFLGFPSATISIETTERVDRLFREFLIPHALKFFAGVLEEKEAPGHARNIAGLILSQRWSRVLPSHLTQNYRPAKSATARNVEEWMETLSAYGWVEPEIAKTSGRLKAWRVNPLVHEAFSERAEFERKTREEKRKSILENLGIYNN